MNAIRPMLAASVDDLSRLVFPLIATPKIDGIRCLTLPPVAHPDEKLQCSAVTRTMKPIPNLHIRRELERHCPPGLDGELIVPNATFQQTLSCVMGHKGSPTFVYNVFDHVQSWHDPKFAKGIMEKYNDRLLRLVNLSLPKFCKYVDHRRLLNRFELEVYEAGMIQGGYEGICLRSPHSPYKFGRSSLREHWLLKLKRFEDSEAVVIGFEELMHNKNPQSLNALGYNERDSHAALMVRGETLGALCVRDLMSSIEFKIGTGWSAMDREELWKMRENGLLGRVLTYKHQPHGRKDKPRTPVFKAWRGHVSR